MPGLPKDHPDAKAWGTWKTVSGHPGVNHSEDELYPVCPS